MAPARIDDSTGARQPIADAGRGDAGAPTGVGPRTVAGVETVRVRVDLDAIGANARALRAELDGDLVGVVKGVAAERRIVEALVDAGVRTIAVSRVPNLRALRDVDAALMMVRTPALTELADVVALADVSIHGSSAVLEAAAAEAERRQTTHRVVPMVDAGDGREGLPGARAAEVLGLVRGRPGLELAHLGINLGCFGDRPDPAAIRRVAERFPDLPLSVGGSGVLLVRDSLPASVASYRVGDALLTGKWESTPIDVLQRGAVELEAEVLTSRADASVVDVGRVTSDPRHLVPTGEFAIERWSNEQTVISEPVPEGEFVSFEMEYDALATTFNSRYV